MLPVFRLLDKPSSAVVITNYILMGKTAVGDSPFETAHKGLGIGHGGENTQDFDRFLCFTKGIS
jgi:hypothetical protein